MATWRLAIGTRSTDAVTVDSVIADGAGYGKLFFSAALPAGVKVGEVVTDSAGNGHLIVSIQDIREFVRAFELDGVAAATGAATIGRAYSALSSAEAAMDSFVANGDIVRAEMYNDSTYTTGFDLSSSALTLGVFVVTAPAGERHTGKAGTGVVIEPAAAGDVLQRTGNTLALVVEWIEIRGWQSNGGDAAAVIFAGSANPSQEDMVRHCILHDDAGGISAENGIIGAANQAILAYNNLIYGVSGTAIQGNYATIFVPTFFDAVVGNTIYGCGVGIKNSAVGATRPVLVQNNAVFDCTTNFQITGTSVWHTLSGGNASNSDLSALPGVNRGNLTTADELVDAGGDDFELKWNGTLPGAGVDTSGVGETFAILVQLGESWLTAPLLDLVGNTRPVLDSGAYAHGSVGVAIGSRAPTSVTIATLTDIPNQAGPEHVIVVDTVAGLLVGEMLTDSASSDFLIRSIVGTKLTLRAVGHAAPPALGTASVERAYSDLQAAETDAVNYLRQGEVWQIELYNDLTYTTAVTFNTAAAKGGRLVVTVPGGERHGGVPGAGVLIVPTGTVTGVIILDTTYDSLVEWIEIKGWKGVDFSFTAAIQDKGTVAGTEGIVQRCIIHDNVPWEGFASGISSQVTGRAFRIRNCLIYGLEAIGIGFVRGVRAEGGLLTVDNCTVSLTEGRGIEGSAGSIARNNLVFGADEAFRSSGQFDETNSGNNLTDDTYAPGTTSETGIVEAKVFRAPSRANYTLRARSPALEAGRDLSADFPDDLAGLVRTPPWDAGGLQVPFPSVLGYETVRQVDVTQVTALGKLRSTTSAEPVLHWYVGGQHVQRGRSRVHGIAMAAAESVPVEAIATIVAPGGGGSFDPFSNAPVGWPVRRTLWFTRSLSAELALYRVQQRQDGGAWVTLARIHRRPHRWFYWIRTPVLADLATYEWQAIPVDKAGNDGTPIALGTHKVVRNPRPPDFTVSFDGGTGKVTLTEVA